MSDDDEKYLRAWQDGVHAATEAMGKMGNAAAWAADQVRRSLGVWEPEQ